MDGFTTRKIEIAASGLLPGHDEAFRVDYRHGHGNFGFVYFYAPVVLEDCNGREERPAGTGIFYLPGQPRYFHATAGSLRHTWFLANGPGIEQCLVEYGIPTFTALDLGDMPFLETFIIEVREEAVAFQEYYDDAISDMFHTFFRKVGVILSDNSRLASETQRTKAKRLNEIRFHVHSDLARKWTVREMAEMEGLNPTRFALDYKTHFGVSPIDDLIDARVSRAEYLLAHFAYTIKQIARECGFDSDEHFSRVFRKRRGCNPSRSRIQ